MEISLIIPAYNEGNRIIDTIERSINFLNKNFKEYELIIVDDGSIDNTLSIINSVNNKLCKLIPLKENKGKGYAVKKGVLSSKGQYCFFTDADLPYGLNNILKSIGIMKDKKCDIILGSRALYDGEHNVPYPLHRKIMSGLFSKYVNTVLNIGVKDTQCGFKGFNAYSARKIFSLTTIEKFGFDVEVIYLAKKFGYKIDYIPVNLTYSVGSTVHIIRDSLKMIKDVNNIKKNDLNGLYPIHY
jgi:dolichyl-phosphate beta-glucosyltransferase